MDALRIPVDKITEQGYAVNVDAPVVEIQPADVEPLPLVRVGVEGTFHPVGDGLLFRGTLSGVFEHACDRCLAPMTVPFSVQVDWLFTPGSTVGIEFEEAEERIYQGNEIDLAPHVWEELVLTMPSRFICGQTEACKAAEDEEAGSTIYADEEPAPASEGLAQLKDLFPNLPSEREKE